MKSNWSNVRVTILLFTGIKPSIYVYLYIICSVLWLVVREFRHEQWSATVWQIMHLLMRVYVHRISAHPSQKQRSPARVILVLENGYTITGARCVQRFMHHMIQH